MNTETDRQFNLNFNKGLFALLMFLAAYMTTITVNAQSYVTDGQNAPSAVITGDAMQFSADGQTTVTGVITAAESDEVTINAAGKEMRILLNKVDLSASAETVFNQGMQVTVTGEMQGERFNVPVLEAKTITASNTGIVTILPDRD